LNAIIFFARSTPAYPFALDSFSSSGNVTTKYSSRHVLVLGKYYSSVLNARESAIECDSDGEYGQCSLSSECHVVF
jgi:hypothetical protein